MHSSNNLIRTAMYFFMLAVFTLQQVKVFSWQEFNLSLGTLAILITAIAGPILLYLRIGLPRNLWVLFAGIVVCITALIVSTFASDHFSVAIKFAARYGTQLALLWIFINMAFISATHTRAAARAAIWFLFFTLTIGAANYLGLAAAADFALNFHSAGAENYMPQVSGIYEHPGIFGSIGVITGFLCIHLWQRKIITRPEMILGVLAAIMTLCLSQARNPALALILVAPFAIVLAPKLKAWIKIVSITGVLCVAALPFVLRFEGLAEFLTVHFSSALTTGRIYIWEGAIRAWQENIWVGTGPGVFQFVIPDFTDGRFHSGELNAHNILLGLLSELGVFGLIAFAWLTYATFASLYRSTQPNSQDRLWVCIWLFLLLAFGVTDFYYYSYGFALHTILIVSFLYGEYMSRKTHKTEPAIT